MKPPRRLPRTLFQLASATDRKRAVSRFRGTPLGRAISKYDRLVASAGNSSRVIKDMLQRLRQQSTRGILQRIVASRSGYDVERYARQPVKNRLLNMLFKALGPIGDVFKSLMFPVGQSIRVGIARQLDAAQRLLESFGYHTIAPPTVSQRTQEEMAEYLRQHGWQVQPPDAQPPVAAGESGDSGHGRRPPAPPNAGDEGRPGRRDPGEGPMIRVQSSNVYAIGFNPDPGGAEIGTLKVQFKAYSPGVGTMDAAGPLYHYFHVPTAVWDAFQVAASKGRFVWDKIRVRGTVSGHHYNWSLAGITHAYVPRRASGEQEGEFFRKRSIAFQGNVLTSELPEVKVRDWGPNRGEPNRGRGDGPNRGRPRGPNRGR